MSTQERTFSSGNLTRRDFIRNAGIATVAATTASSIEAHAKAIGPNSRLGVGLIGCGGRGHAHLQTLGYVKEQNKDIDIVAVCDAYRPRGQKAADDLKAKYYMDHRELLADKKVDVVFIATPDHHHCHQAIDAIKAGKDVYCEKPVSHWRQFDKVKELSQVVAQSDRVFQLGTQAMSDNAWRQMRKMIQDGMIGQPLHAECGYFRVGDWGERGMPIDDPNAKPGKDLNWEAFLGDSPKRDFDVSRFFRWRMYEDYAGGPVTDLFPHSLTPVVYMLGVTFPSMVVATGGKFRYDEREIPDTFNTLIDYPEKITVAVLGTQGNDYAGTGGRGAGNRIPIIRGWEGSLTIVDNDIVWVPTEMKKTNREKKQFPIEYEENMTTYFRHFLDCCKNRERTTWSPADMAYHVQTALQMGYLGLREGKVAKFDRDRETILL